MPNDDRPEVTGAIELAAEIVEPAVDSLLDSGLLRDIPILGSIIKAASVARSIRDRIFLVKVSRFLQGLEEVSAADAGALAEEIDQDNATARRAGETVLLAIDSLNDLEKARILGYVFAAYLRQEISVDTLQRLNNAIALAMVDDLWVLADEAADNVWEKAQHARRLAALHSLRITGLSAFEDSAFQFVGKRSFIGTEVTSLGEELIRILRRCRGTRSGGG